MKYEPLKEKIRFLRIESTSENVILGSPFMYLHDVKSAVQGVLQEIDKNIKKWEETMEKADEITRERIASRIDELEFCKDLIKKWLQV